MTNSERRVQRVRKALDPPGEAREDTWIIAELARRLGHDWGEPTAEETWDELRSLSPMHRGMSYERLEQQGGLQWPCPDEEHPGSPFLHGRLWESRAGGPAAPFSAVQHQPPFEALDADYPIRLTTGRRLESYNTGVQSNLYRSPLHRGESIDLSPEDVERLLLEDGEIVKVSSRRGSVEAPVRIDPSLRPGLAFMTLHFPGPGRHERAHDRRHRPEVGNGRVQGRRDPRREARSATSRCRPAGRAAARASPATDRAAADGASRLGSIRGSSPARRPANRGGACRGRPPARARPAPAGTAERVTPRVDGRVAVARGAHGAKERRDLLLPALHAVQEHIGWISPARSTTSAAG